jgi:predicted nucleotidyltransferase component of viral defense system
MFFFRLATHEEVGFYNGVVYAVQDTFLKVFFERLGDIFRLTGGTALSRFYLKHRLS